jgi:hypothetical protein
MSRYKKGDIVICTDVYAYGMRNESLVLLDKYKVLDVINMYEKVLIDLLHVDTNFRSGLFDDKHFIHLDVWREFQLRKILK